MRAWAGVACGVNRRHVCTVDQCRFVQRRTGKRGGVVAVCTQSLHFHRCARGVCNEGVTAPDTSTICPITGIELAGPAELYYPTRSKMRGSWCRPFCNSMTPDRRGNRKRPGAGRRRGSRSGSSTSVATRVALQNLFLSATSVQLREERMRRRAAATTAIAAAAPCDFMAQMTAARAHYPRTRVPSQVDSRVRALVGPVDRYVAMVRARMISGKGHNAVVAAVVSYLATGLGPPGATQLIPKVPWISELAPLPQDYGKIVGFQCRPLSAASRAIKSLAFTADGLPDLSMVFGPIPGCPTPPRGPRGPREGVAAGPRPPVGKKW